MAAPEPDTSRTLYTVGHSNHGPAAFLALLRRHGIGRVADVRSRPYSRWPHFGRERLVRLLETAGIAYVWLGEALGGRPQDPAVLAVDGAPDYAAMARQPAFHEGLERLLALLDTAERVAVLCSEGNPGHCHREHLIARALRPRGVRVVHILRDGRTSDAAAGAEPDSLQLSLEV